MKLIDTHTHFDVPEYQSNLQGYVNRALASGVQHLVIIGYLAEYFDRMIAVSQQTGKLGLPAHLAFGLHPLYIHKHQMQDLAKLEQYLQTYGSIAIAEIGLDTYHRALADEAVFDKQKMFFVEQIHLAKQFGLPVILHIRKCHADVLKILKEQRYQASELGGIAHSFSGGEQEALAFAKMGFKIGITGQITNPNAKKLHRAVQAVYHKYGLQSFVIETDCPDMTPLPCQHLGMNEPANLPYVLQSLSALFGVEEGILAKQVWQNSNQALRQQWEYHSNG